MLHRSLFFQAIAVIALTSCGGNDAPNVSGLLVCAENCPHAGYYYDDEQDTLWTDDVQGWLWDCSDEIHFCTGGSLPVSYPRSRDWNDEFWTLGDVEFSLTKGADPQPECELATGETLYTLLAHPLSPGSTDREFAYVISKKLGIVSLRATYCLGYPDPDCSVTETAVYRGCRERNFFLDGSNTEKTR